tara:strand:- start:370 stop:519 length:150 start_codon:yes stop_codon:yes gene_type:complete
MLEDYWHGEKTSENVEQREKRERGTYAKQNEFVEFFENASNHSKERNDA